MDVHLSNSRGQEQPVLHCCSLQACQPSRIYFLPQFLLRNTTFSHHELLPLLLLPAKQIHSCTMNELLLLSAAKSMQAGKQAWSWECVCVRARATTWKNSTTWARHNGWWSLRKFAMAMRRFRVLLLLLSLVVVVVVSLSPSSELDTSTIVFPTTQSLLVGSTESAAAGGARDFFFVSFSRAINP